MSADQTNPKSWSRLESRGGYTNCFSLSLKLHDRAFGLGKGLLSLSALVVKEENAGHFLESAVSVELALLLCLSLTFCSFANKQLVFFGPSCPFSRDKLGTQLLDVLMWAVTRVLLICAMQSVQHSACETL